MKTLNQLRGLLVVLMLTLVSGCSLNLISDYDEQSLQNMENIAKKVDLFYSRVLNTDVSKRRYRNFNQEYVIIDVDLRSLLMRQKVRELNELTTEQVEIAIDLWRQDMKQHQQRDTISDFILKRHRQQFQRVFLAMIKGEQSKPTQTQTN